MNILLVSYLSSYSQGVGAKRWLKLSKYIARAHKVILLTPSLNASQTYPAHFSDVITYRSAYPSYLTGKSSSLVDKVNYKIDTTVRDKWFKQNPYDRAFNDFKEFKKGFEKSLAKNIDWVIVTGAPFELCYQTVQLCEKYKLKCWVDFRDPWTWGQGYGMNLLSNETFLSQKTKEQFTIKHASIISTPVAAMQKHLQRSYQGYESKFVLVPHGFDPEDFAFVNDRNSRTDSKFRLIYGGTVYDGQATVIHRWLELFDKSGIDFELDIYALNHLDDELQGLANHDKVKVHSPVPNQELVNRIAQSDIYIAFFPNRYKDFVSTKFIEIAVCKTPVLLVAPEGELSSFVQDMGLGVAIDPMNKEQKDLREVLKTTIRTRSRIDLDSFSFKTLSKTIIWHMHVLQNKTSSDRA